MVLSALEALKYSKNTAEGRWQRGIDVKGPLTRCLTWTIIGVAALLLGWKWAG